MKRLKLTNKQEYLSYNGQDLIILDTIQDLPDNDAHYSEYVLVIICTMGEIQVEYDGSPVNIHQGEIFLGVPGSVLAAYTITEDFDCKLLAIKHTELMSSREMHAHIINSLLYIKSHPVTEMTDEDHQIVFNYYDLICSLIRESQHRYHKGELRALLNAFLLKVLGIMDNEMVLNGPDASIRADQIVEKFVRMVNEDGGINRRVEYYAQQLFITPKYLSSLVRTTLCRTPLDVITVVAVKEIERRLRYSERSIKEISTTMNFPNTSFFGKYFKQHTGFSPNAYRKKFHKN